MDTRRNFLGNILGAGLFPLGPFTARAAANAPSAQRENPITRIPDHFDAVLALSPEQKVLLAATLASGCDAGGYYTPGANGNEFTLNKHIGIYHDIPFAPTLVYPPAQNTPYHIPVKADGQIKGVIVLHPSLVSVDQAEPASCRTAKLKMARDIIAEHSDLFGVSGEILQRRQQAHCSLEQKKQFFLTLIKDMFSTFTELNPGHGPLTHRPVQAARNTQELKTALRAVAGVASDSDQYSHVLGVTELFEFAMNKAVNGNPHHAVMNADQIEMGTLAALLHDVGKTQVPSQGMAKRPPQNSGLDNLIMTSRNGSHPYFTAVMLSLYPEALDAAAHHHGLARYGEEEQKKITADYQKMHLGVSASDFTVMTGPDIAPNRLPPLTKLLRVADVAESITGRVDKPMHEAIRQLGTVGRADNPKDLFNKVRIGADEKPLITPDTVDPDCLCFLLANGVFEAYGEKRTNEASGWLDKNKNPKYQKEEVAKIKTQILHNYGWDIPAIREQKEAEIRKAITSDPLVRENRAAQHQAAANIGRAL